MVSNISLMKVMESWFESMKREINECQCFSTNTLAYFGEDDSNEERVFHNTDNDTREKCNNTGTRGFIS